MSPMWPTNHSSVVQATGKIAHSGTAGAASRTRTMNQNMHAVNRPSAAIVAK